MLVDVGRSSLEPASPIAIVVGDIAPFRPEAANVRFECLADATNEPLGLPQSSAKGGPSQPAYFRFPSTADVRFKRLPRKAVGETLSLDQPYALVKEGYVPAKARAMEWQDAALGLAGVIGSGVAVVHGILTQRLMVRPLEELLLANKRSAPTIRRLVLLLLHFSTISWFLGGLALVVAAIWFNRDTRLATGLLVGSLYLLGALGNLWATRGRHPGWMLMAAAVILILLSVGAFRG